eukprot:Lankesteria_metandrocarpae@DN5299_c2_g1_i1.p1
MVYVGVLILLLLGVGVSICEGGGFEPDDGFLGQDDGGLGVNITDIAVDTDPQSRRAALRDIFLGADLESGYIRVGKNGGAMFYLLDRYQPVQNSEAKQDVPLILWLTGGPGCSSFLAFLTENGSVTLTTNNNATTMQRNPHSWSHAGHVVYVDQPIGVGFSAVGDWMDFATDEESSVTPYLREFLTKFAKLMGFEGSSLVISGESYAGHYIPVLAQSVAKEPIDGLTLTHVVLGNAWIDPALQLPSLADYALHEGIINVTEFAETLNRLHTCENLIRNEKWSVATVQCSHVINQTLKDRNPYDIRQSCDVSLRPLCYDFAPVEAFVNDPRLVAALGGARHWSVCSPLVGNFLSGEMMQGDVYRKCIGDILDARIPVLVFAGEKDLLCNWVGSLRWTQALEWTGMEGYSKAQLLKWPSDDSEVGLVQSFSTLTYMKVLNAGHMVPMDQPEGALKMLQEFLRTGKLAPHKIVVATA